MAVVNRPELDVDDIVAAVQYQYSSLNVKLPVGKFTILASFILWNDTEHTFKIISLATGLKCLPTARLSLTAAAGDVLHDSHAEILARRGAIRWFMEEIGRSSSSSNDDSEGHHARDSDWIEQTSQLKTATTRFSLKEGVRVVMYISTVPCGDASTRYLASFQDEEMAALKDSAIRPASVLPGTPARGRDNYALYSVLRTKPGRADSLPTSCMSCSDKIASWNVFGFQGAIASFFLDPLYITTIVIGEVGQTMQESVREDCLRAFWKRVSCVQGPFPALALSRSLCIPARASKEFPSPATFYLFHLDILPVLPYTFGIANDRSGHTLQRRYVGRGSEYHIAEGLRIAADI